MPSRMERYYQTDVDISKRTKKNQRLYDEIYSEVDYSDIKQVPNANEINVEKLNEILNADKKNNSRVLKGENTQITEFPEYEEETKNYDINTMLEKAKNDKSPAQINYHKLKQEQINLLRKIEDYKASKREQDENLNELLNTIASTELLKEINDRELSLDLLGDLKSSNEETIVGGINSINKIMNDYTTQKKDMKDIEEKNEIDKSFYTSSMNFNEEDFEDLKEITNKLNKNNARMRMIVSILCVIIVIIIILLIIH